jgi:hypothetical protein
VAHRRAIELAEDGDLVVGERNGLVVEAARTVKVVELFRGDLGGPKERRHARVGREIGGVAAALESGDARTVIARVEQKVVEHRNDRCGAGIRFECGGEGAARASDVAGRLGDLGEPKMKRGRKTSLGAVGQEPLRFGGGALEIAGELAGDEVGLV